MKAKHPDVAIRKTLEYKEYIGEFGIEDGGLLFGRVLGLRDSILTFEGHTPSELQRDLEEVIEEYLHDCQVDGVAPELSFKGSFNIRIGSDRHARLAKIALQENLTINKLVSNAIDEYLSRY
jgi:predicted HicB family RNase H-like nuclease